MFTIQKNSFLVFLFTIFAFAAVAQENKTKEEELKEFLSTSEFGLQRKVIKEGSVGQKGLIGGEVEKTDIKDVLTVDLIDPFANVAISGTKTDLDHLDDGIDIPEDEMITESINSFRGKVEEYFAKIEDQEDIDAVELLDNLVVSQIISSPMKYVVIQNRKYKEKDIIKVRVNRFSNDTEFQEMLNSVKVQTEDAEEAEMLEELKAEATERYKSLTENSETALNIVKIEIGAIAKHQVSFIIDDKEYKMVMKN